MLGGYSVGIEIHLIDHVTAAMASVNSSLIKAQGNTTAFQKALEGVHTQMSRLQAIQEIGGGMFKGAAASINAMIEPTSRYAQQINSMNMAGIQHLEIQKNIAATWKAMKEVPSLDVTHGLELQSDLSSIMGKDPKHLQEIRDLLPTFAKMETVMIGATGDQHSAEGQILAGIKTADMLGKVEPKEMTDFMEGMLKVTQATNNRVNMSMYQGVVKYLREGKLTADDDFLLTKLPVFMEEMATQNGGSGGGGGPGAMFASFFRTFVQGRMSKKAFGFLDTLGLVKEGDSLETTTTGTIADHIVGGEIAAKDPVEYMKQFWIPAMHQAYPETANDNTLMILKTMQAGIGTQLTGAVVGEMLNKISTGQLDRFGEQYKAVPNLNESYKKAQKSPVVGKQSWENSWSNAMVSVAESLVPLLDYVKEFAALIGQIANWFHENQWASELVLVLIATTGIVGGLLAVGAAILTTIIVFDLLGLGLGAVGWLVGGVVLAFGLVSSTLLNLIHQFPKFLKFLEDFSKALMGGFKSSWDFIIKETNKFLESFTNLLFKKLFGLQLADPVEQREAMMKRQDARDSEQSFNPIFKKQNDDTAKIPNVQMTVPNINVTAAPGQSPKEIAVQVKRMLIEALHNGLLSGVGTTGLYFGHEIYP